MASVAIGAACAAPIDVATERSDRVESDGQGDSGGQEVAAPVPTPAPASDLEWSSCDQFGIPDFVGTTGWECATLDVAMDPFGGGAADERIQLAMTRHRATGERVGSLLTNPGGPGASGLEFAWGIRPTFPADVLRSYDIVGWDPRGVGQSIPAISCGDDPDFDKAFVMRVCAEETGPLAAHLSAPYSAADMEAIRVALGERRLDYLGYSYGTTLGAAYATRYPETVGRFVLDGATDPKVGSRDGPFDEGFYYYADDGYPNASTRFDELCDASKRCALGDSTFDAIEQIIDGIDKLPTNDYEGAPDIVDRDVFIDLWSSSLNYSGDWELLATAMADAVGGDASATASLVAFDPVISSEALDEPVDGFEVANIVIYCADFRHVFDAGSYCDGLPTSVETLEPVAPVDVAVPILVIGTEFDPATPGKHAPEFAAALGDAVSISWAGVGHTAFPAPTRCIDDAVVDFLLDGSVPDDGLVCPFLDEAGPDPSDEDLGDILFGHGDAESERVLIDVFEFGFETDIETARCAARLVNELDDRTISHVILAVTSADSDAAITDALTAC